MSHTPAPVRRARKSERAARKRRARNQHSAHRVVAHVELDDNGHTAARIEVHVICESGRHANCRADWNCQCEEWTAQGVNAAGLPVHEGWDDDVDHVGRWVHRCSMLDWADYDEASLEDAAFESACQGRGSIAGPVEPEWEGGYYSFIPVPQHRQILHHSKSRKLVRA